MLVDLPGVYKDFGSRNITPSPPFSNILLVNSSKCSFPSHLTNSTTFAKEGSFKF